ncbi:MAG: phytoene desaturase family protein [Bradymonadaceae bacterium]
MNVGVVGAGMGGLAAAISLAARGCDVTVWERADQPGGKVGQSQADGVAFDTGPSVLDELFAAAGADLESRLALRRPDPWFRYRFSDGSSLEIAHELDRTLENVEAAFGRSARDDFAGFLDYARDIWEAAAPNFIFAPAPSVGRLLGVGLSAPLELWQIDPISTMSDAIRERVDDPRLRWLLARYATYVGADPRRAPATLNCISWLELGRGGWGVEGGMYELVRSLAELAGDLGVEIRLGAPVERVECRGGCVREVTVAGRTEQVDALVYNGEVGSLGRLLDDVELGPIEPDSPPSMSGWTAVWRSTAPRDERAAHTVLFPDAYAAEFDAIFERGEVPAEPTVYVCDQSVAHGRSGWSGASPLFAMINAPAVDSTDGSPAVERSRIRTRVRRRLLEAELIEEGDEVVWERGPGDLAERFADSGGAIYGRAPHSRLAAFERPSNCVDAVDGLYLAGAGAHPGAGVPMCLQSGRLAARALDEDA